MQDYGLLQYYRDHRGEVSVSCDPSSMFFLSYLDHQPNRTLAELNADLGFPEDEINRIYAKVKAAGYVEYSDDSGRLQLTDEGEELVQSVMAVARRIGRDEASSDWPSDQPSTIRTVEAWYARRRRQNAGTADRARGDIRSPFESIEAAMEFIELLGETADEAIQEIELELRKTPEDARARDAWSLALQKLKMLAFYVHNSQRMLNHLLTLRRMLDDPQVDANRSIRGDVAS